MRILWCAVLLCCGGWMSGNALAQNIYRDKLYQFVSYEAIPTWVGVATDWDKAEAKLHIYDHLAYQGHAQYVSVALKTGITFAQFKERVREYETRKYLPFFLFDLRAKPPVIDGKSYAWALQIEDYSYRDDAAQMTKTVLRMLSTVEAYIQAATGKSTKGIVVLATNPESRPNTSLAPALNQAGYPNRTANQLMQLMGGKHVHVLNAGTGYGYLRYVPAGEERTAQLNAKDIVIYARMPARVPPVKGIITLEPQTPLSHVNLLAKNRGTFNLYALDTAAIPGLHAAIDQLVKIECNAKRVTLQKATLKEAQTYWEKHHVDIELPDASFAATEILDLGAGKGADLTAQIVGAKAANYARIQRLFPYYVKPGFAIPFYHYQQTMKRAGVDADIADFLQIIAYMQPKDIEAALGEIQRKILAAHIDPALAAAVQQVAQTHFGGKRIRLRSSTNCEDLPGFNGAGLYISKGLDPDEIPAKVEDKILQIYASLWTPTAYAERQYYGIDHSKAAMSILINEAYSSEFANGVVLTIPDKSGFAIAINTQYGDAAVTNPENGQVPEALLYKKSTDKTALVETRSNIHDIFLQDSLKPLLEELKQLTIQVHRAFAELNPAQGKTAYGVDMEFKVALEDGQYKLYLKQARPLGQVLPE